MHYCSIPRQMKWTLKCFPITPTHVQMLGKWDLTVSYAFP